MGIQDKDQLPLDAYPFRPQPEHKVNYDLCFSKGTFTIWRLIIKGQSDKNSSKLAWLGILSTDIVVSSTITFAQSFRDYKVRFHISPHPEKI